MNNPWLHKRITQGTVRALLPRIVADFLPAPDNLSGIGCCISAGGRILPTAYAACAMLRRHGWQHPIRIYYIGNREPGPDRRFARYDVEPFDASRLPPVRKMHGWLLKAYSCLHSPYEHVLSLDADSFAQSDLSRIFSAPEYADTGLVLTPDINKCRKDNKAFTMMGIPCPTDYQEAESGQVWLNKRTRWRLLNLVHFMNDQPEVFWKYVYGDKEMWPLASLFLKEPYTITPSCRWIDDGMEHRWFDDSLLTHHACQPKRGGSYRPEIQELLRAYQEQR